MVQPKKHLGQHFLMDKNIARKIVSSLRPDTTNVLEIGPGTGVLTGILLEEDIKNLKVIEIDNESIIYLKTTYPRFSDNIVTGDFLKYNLTDIFQDNFSVIGNFPYNISSQILFKVLDYRNQVDEVVGMFQKEVAERIASPHGNKKHGILSVLVQAFYTIEYLFTVSEQVFFPPPNVKSAVIRLKRNEIKTLDCDEKIFFNLVKAGFNQRRKTLRNSLGSFTFQKNERITELLSKRAEQLTVNEFEILAQSVVN